MQQHPYINPRRVQHHTMFQSHCCVQKIIRVFGCCVRKILGQSNFFITPYVSLWFSFIRRSAVTRLHPNENNTPINIIHKDHNPTKEKELLDCSLKGSILFLLILILFQSPSLLSEEKSWREYSTGWKEHELVVSVTICQYFYRGYSCRTEKNHPTQKMVHNTFNKGCSFVKEAGTW